MSRINERRYRVIVNDRNVFVRNRRFLRPSVIKTNPVCNNTQPKQVTWSTNNNLKKGKDSVGKNVNSHLNFSLPVAPHNNISDNIKEPSVSETPNNSANATEQRPSPEKHSEVRENVPDTTEGKVTRSGRLSKKPKRLVLGID
jgi:hypothetical protein